MLHEVWVDRDDLVKVRMKRAYRSALETRLPDLLREPRPSRGVAILQADATFFAKPQHP
jgi:hypothetical protein